MGPPRSARTTEKGKRITPVRTQGDKPISYDLTNGGTTPVISLRNWNGSNWDAPVVISGGNNPDAVGSVNTSAITANAGGDNGVGALGAFTFGEAVISFQALFGDTCGRFGSADLKSRSSDSFNAELKDFVAPEQVQISNCAASVSTTQHVRGGVVHDRHQQRLTTAIERTARRAGRTGPPGARRVSAGFHQARTALELARRGDDRA